MTDNFTKTRIKPGTKIDLSKISPDETFGWSKSDAKEQTEKNLARIAELQELLYAEKKHSILIVLQGMDAGGKDGTVKHIGGAMNPAGTRVTSFKAPTKEELSHDFLWRIDNAAPKKAGEVAIFNRSQYEDVGIVRVHDLVPESVWRPRFKQIKDYEEKLSEPTEEIPGGVHVIKFWLHISKDEQWDRFRERVMDPEKNWKFSSHDLEERKYWDEYMKAYSEAISETSTDKAPWFVIPADNKWMRDLIISQIVVNQLEALKMEYPAADPKLEEIREKYFENEKEGKKAFNAAANDDKAKKQDEKPAAKKPKSAHPKP